MTIMNALQRDLLQRFAEEQLNDLEISQVRLLLKRFVGGEMDEVESEQVIEIIGENERCLDFVESLWLEEPIGQALADTTLPDLTTRSRISEQLFRQIRRANAVGTAVSFGVRGFGMVTTGLLKPLVSRKNNHKWQTRRERRKKMQ